VFVSKQVGCPSAYFDGLEGLAAPELLPFLPPPLAVKMVPERKPTAKKEKYMMAAGVLISFLIKGGRENEIVERLFSPTSTTKSKSTITKIVLKRSLAFIGRTETVKKGMGHVKLSRDLIRPAVEKNGLNVFGVPPSGGQVIANPIF